MNEVLDATSRIVAAYIMRSENIERNPFDAIPTLIRSVMVALEGSPDESDTKAEPPRLGRHLMGEASIESVDLPSQRRDTKDMVYCRLCAFGGKMLRRHILAAHGLSPDEYRQKVGLSADAPIISANYASARSDMAKANGLGRKVPGQNSGGSPFRKPGRSRNRKERALGREAAD